MSRGENMDEGYPYPADGEAGGSTNYAPYCSFV
jgi:hypothetical protein